MSNAHSSDPAGLTDRMGREQLASLFQNLPLGVLAASATAWLLALFVLNDAALALPLRAGWAAAVSIGAGAHLLLRWAHRQNPRAASWRSWAIAFTAITFFEAVAWASIPIAVGVGGNFDNEMLVVVVTLGVAAGAIPAFSAYYPAFAAFLLTVTLPYAAWSAVTPSPLHGATTVLMLVFTGAFSALGLSANRSFKDLVKLRFEAADLAERLHHEKEIAEAASRSKSSFLAAASHDLRQPVHALGLFVGALRNMPMSRDAQELVAHIEASTNAMDGLFTALLDISRLDAGIVEIHPSAFDLGAQLQRIAAEHGNEAALRGLTLHCEPTSAIVFSDPVLIERIVRNLVSNAIRYTDHGRVLVGTRRRGSNVAIQVLDTGRGIPPALQEQIFEEYFQLDNPERDRTKGLGLGLAIVRRLCSLLALPIALRSTLGGGSCFEIVVPLADAQQRPAEREADTPARIGRGLVVVIDDETAIRDGMAALLNGWNYDVVTAASGDEAIARLSTSDRIPDLIVSDYRLLGEETGAAVIERLQSEYNEPIPAILITGDTSPDRLAEAHASGQLLLHKPVPNSRLRAALANLAARQ
jgi:signal transduction histidine kinase/CheY-like chemotaxis protein